MRWFARQPSTPAPFPEAPSLFRVLAIVDSLVRRLGYGIDGDHVVKSPIPSHAGTTLRDEIHRRIQELHEAQAADRAACQETLRLVRQMSAALHCLDGTTQQSRGKGQRPLTEPHHPLLPRPVRKKRPQV